MPLKQIARWVLLLGLLGVGNMALAQDAAPQNKSFFDRLDDFGKGVVGIFVPADKDKDKNIPAPKDSQQSYTRKPAPGQSPDDVPDSPRAGSVLSGNTRTSPSSARAPAARPSIEETPTADNLPAPPVAGGAVAKPVRRQAADVLPFETPSISESSKPSDPLVPPPAARTAALSASTPDSLPQPSDIGATPKPTARPLHEQLLGLRQSAFPSSEQRDAAAPASIPAARDAAAPVSSQPASVETVATPKLAVRRSASQPAASAARSGGEPATGPALGPASSGNKATTDTAVLFTRNGPVLGVETLGPRKIAVGKESAYEVSIVNSGEVAADDLLVFVSLPDWAEVAATEATSGSAQAAAASGGSIAVQWRVGHLNVKERERLVLRIVPRQSKPFDLAVRWEYKPTASQTQIEVQEPKLVLQLEGPREVLYGKKELYRLKLANTGTGNAENVTIMLMPLGTGDNVPASHKLGVLAAGEQKMLDVELTARQAGHLTIQAEVRGDAGAHAALTEDVLVRRADLKIDVEGPKVQFVGQQATYTLRVRNAGTATAKNLSLSATLPGGAKYVSGIEDAKTDAAGTRLEWSLEKLAPEMDQTYVIRCNLGMPGANRMEIRITAEDDVSAVTVANTRVDSVANLVMDVKDPSAPVAVGEEAIYEVRVRNRGTKEAENVEVFAYFSRGIEPVSAEGAPSQIATGQVIFRPITAIAPGSEMVLKVHARAQAAGNHVFRAETRCQTLGARLISEATNLYYADGPSAAPAAKETPSTAPRVDGGLPTSPHGSEHPSQAVVTPGLPRK